MAFCAAVVGCTHFERSSEWRAHGRRGMVASDSAAASRVGLEVLRSGGNAIDAAVATSFALAVTRPQSTGLGGGGFLIYRQASDGSIYVLDFRETAPGASGPEFFERAARDKPSNPFPPSRVGWLAVAVPGSVAGYLSAHERFGTRPLSDLLAGAVMLAYPIEGVDDSKKLTEKKRNHLYDQIQCGDHAVGVSIISASKVDEFIQGVDQRQSGAHAQYENAGG